MCYFKKKKIILIIIKLCMKKKNFFLTYIIVTIHIFLTMNRNDFQWYRVETYHKI